MTPNPTTTLSATEFAELVQQASHKLQQFIINGMMKHGDPLCYFYASIRKHAQQLAGGTACVVATERGIKFFYDPRFVLKSSDDELSFMLAHELMHIVNRHFVRGDRIMTDLAIDTALFYQRYAPYADLPVNESLASMPGVDFSKFLTYETTEIDKHQCQSFEQIVAYLRANPDKNTMPKTVRVVRLSETGELFNPDGTPYTGPMNPRQEPNTDGDGSAGAGSDGAGTTPVNGDGNASGTGQSTGALSPSAGGLHPGSVVYENTDEMVIVVPELPTDANGAEREIKSTFIRVLEKNRDNSGRFGTLMQEFVMDQSMSKSIWKQLEERIKKLGTKMRSKVYNSLRFSRKTQLPPGKSKQRGFTLKVIVDESGSMGDLEVQFGLDIIKQAGLSSSRDTIHVLRWTTSPDPNVDVLNNYHQKWNRPLARKNTGGTDFSDIFTHEISSTIKDDVTIVFTDGYCGYPAQPSGRPEIWIFTQEGGMKSWKQEYGHGLALLIPEDEIAALYKSA